MVMKLEGIAGLCTDRALDAIKLHTKNAIKLRLREDQGKQPQKIMPALSRFLDRAVYCQKA